MNDKEDIVPLNGEDSELEQEQNESESGMFEHFRFTVDKGQEMLRIDKYLTAHMEGTSRHRIQLAMDAGYINVNGNPTKSSYKIKPLDVITISLPYRRRGFEILPEEMPLDIRYEDEDVLVINKPAGLVVHPGHGHYSGTLLNGLAWYLGRRQDADAEDDRMGILVHRIDKDTSGTLLIAKNDDAQMFLSQQFFHHTIERRYTAIVWGDIEEDQGTVDANIGRDPNDRIRYKVVDEASGKHAVTHWKVLQRLGYVTVIECRLETGRTHQIRVHMNHIGHPLFNDSLYGGDRIMKGTLYSRYRQFIDHCFAILPRQALHARTLGFSHPRTHEHIHVESELPDDMVNLIRKFAAFTASR
ncbi:MAG: RluA family pseudouridine synthase [Alistipes sp.]|nr:RluA family pseudouridine synthase [Candidatus Minthomonas equi]